MKLEISLFGLASLIQSLVSAPVNDTTEIIQKDVYLPYHLAIDRNRNTLFLSDSLGKDKEIMFRTLVLNLKENTAEEVPTVVNGFANAVDPESGTVYIGGEDGIYNYDYDTKRAVKLNITDQNVWQMFYKDGLYFTTYPDEKAYIHKNGVTELVPELKNTTAQTMATDGKNIYFCRQGELLKIVDGETLYLGDLNVNAFNTDAKGDVYFSTPSGIFKIVTGGTKKVATAEDIYGFVIDGDGSLIFATNDSIVRFSKTVDECIAEYEYGGFPSCHLDMDDDDTRK